MRRYLIAALLILSQLPISCKKASINESIVMLSNPLVGSCTGFQVEAPSGRTYLLTAGHCGALADSQGSITVTLEDGATLQRRMIASSATDDILLLEGVPGLKSFHLAKSDYPFESVSIIGHGYGLPLWEVDGKLIGEVNMIVWLEEMCSAGAAPGHSGSPALDPAGRIIGVVSTSNGQITGLVRLAALQAFLRGY
jgi:S1-C subfamily serine protease